MNCPIFKIVLLMLTFRIFLDYIAMKIHAFIIIIIDDNNLLESNYLHFYYYHHDNKLLESNYVRYCVCVRERERCFKSYRGHSGEQNRHVFCHV